MLLPVLIALQASTPVPAVPDYQYLLVSHEPSIQLLPSIIARATPAARRAPSEGDRFASCDGRAGFSITSRCVRALLPDRRPPTVALAIEAEIVSNVSGSVTFRRDTLWCIGSRGTARIQLGDELADVPPAEIVEKLPVCVAGALAEPSGWGGAEDRSGGRTWRFPIEEERLAGDGPHARGRGSEYAVVEAMDVVTTHRTTGRCSFEGRIVYVESGRRLRAGDRIALEAPCRWEGGDKLSRMFTQTGLSAGRSARVYVDYSDGTLQYLEAL